MKNISHNQSLQSHNTFGIDVRAKSFALITELDQLNELFSDKEVINQPLLYLGGGSNMLFTQDFAGLVIKMGIKGIAYEKAGPEVYVKAGGGEVWNDLVNYCVDHGFAGIENLSLIPGSVGASPIQNIGAYGVELQDVFHQAEAFDTKTLTMRTFGKEACRFAYRDSIFKGEARGRYIICTLTLKLSTEAKLNTTYGAIETELQLRGISRPSIKDISQVVSAIRVSKLPDPSTIGNAGSFFKNPIVDKSIVDHLKASQPALVHYPMGPEKEKLAAGWLIEQCGWKGKVVGHTGTWKNQALVLVNHGGATGQEIYEFSEQIITSVKEKFGVVLEREVNVF